MSGGAYESMLILGIVVGVFAIVGVMIAFIELGWRWRVLAIALLFAAAASATIGGLEVRAVTEASKHRECFDVTSVDNGQGWAHSAEIYASPHAYRPQSDDVIGNVQPGHHYCGIVENDPNWSIAVLVSVEHP